MENDQIVIGIAVIIIVLLIAVGFIFILVRYANTRKKKHIIEKKELEAKFKEELLQSELEIQETTFSNISHEIHDNVGQLLSLAKIQVNILENKNELDRILLKDLKESISLAIQDLRGIARRLDNNRIKLCKLNELVNYELERIDRTGIKINYCVSGNEVNLKEQKKLITYRIIQESLQNILKHATCQNVFITFHYEIDNLQIEIRDDGVGFDIASVDPAKGLGLQNILNRTKLIGGTSSINSQLNGGTTIMIKLPYDE